MSNGEREPKVARSRFHAIFASEENSCAPSPKDDDVIARSTQGCANDLILGECGVPSRLPFQPGSLTREKSFAKRTQPRARDAELRHRALGAVEEATAEHPFRRAVLDDLARAVRNAAKPSFR